MRLVNHATNTKEFYHIETSDDFCEPEVVKKAAERVRHTCELDDADAAQLEAIVALELLRFEYASTEMPVSELQIQMQKLRNELFDLHGREPLDNGKIDKVFYELLNEEYGHVTK